MSNWKSKTLAHWDAINSLAVRRFGDNPLAEEAALAVVECLQADDWKRVRAFSGKSSFANFIRAISARLLEDFARKRYGRIRPPLWVRTLGGVWEKLFELLCLGRFSVLDAVEIVSQYSAKQYAELEDTAYELLGRIPNCGQHQGLEVGYEESDDNIYSGTSTLNSSYEEQQKEELLAAVFAMVLGSYGEDVDGKLIGKFNQLQIHLKSEEKLLLRLCYQEDMSVAGAGNLLGMTRFQAHGKMRRLMKRLNEEFNRVGLTEELKQYL